MMESETSKILHNSMTTGYRDAGKKRVAVTFARKIRKEFKGVASDSFS